jgi:hypothetical protein
MKAKLDEDRAPYQEALRMIGAHLDAHRATRARVLEDESGFIVSYQGDDNLDLTTDHFTYSDVFDFQIEGEARRSRQVDVSEYPRTYQDFLRALGYELDQAEACEILLDELDDETTVVTYQHTDRDSVLMWKKGIVTVGPKERAALLASAHGRRQTSEGRRGLRRLLG